MAISEDFCEARATEAADAAAGAALGNVRDRELRSEAAWRTMAKRIRETQTARAERDAARIMGEVEDAGIGLPV